MMKGRRVVCAVALIFAATDVFAWLRPSCDDWEVVERSKLIVVAKIDPASIKYVSHKSDGESGNSGEFHAELIISEVLKGRCAETKIPFTFHYGLTPVGNGISNQGPGQMSFRMMAENSPKEAVFVFDTGNSVVSATPLVGDIRENHLWFLQKRSGTYGREVGSGNRYGIADPEEIQELKWKDYYLCYLAKEPEPAMRALAGQNPAVAARSEGYFGHLKVGGILKIENLRERFEALLPFYLDRPQWNALSPKWNLQQAARKGIVGCGEATGAGLMKIFDEPMGRELRLDIITLWRDIGYEPAVPLLTNLLKDNFEFWTSQDLEKGWLDDFDNSDSYKERRAKNAEARYSVSAIGSLGKEKNLPVLERIRKQWNEIGLDEGGVVKQCDSAIKQILERAADTK